MGPKKKKGRSQSRGRSASRAGSEAPEGGSKKKGGKKKPQTKQEELMSPSSILKIVILVFTLICYGLLIGFHSDIQPPYERLLVCALFSAFMIIYLALVVGIVTAKAVDKVLAAVWALYAASVYLACGVLLIIMMHKSSSMGLATGVIAMIVAIMCMADCWFTARI